MEPLPTCPPKKIPVRGVSETARPKGFVTCGAQMTPCTIAANKGPLYGTSEGVLLQPKPLLSPLSLRLFGLLGAFSALRMTHDGT